MPKFTEAGFKAEKIAVAQFKGEAVTDLSMQYRDIDAILPTKKGKRLTASVKDQLWSSEKYGGIQIETKLTNTRTGASMDGCFLQNESEMYFWRIHTPEYGDTWLIIPSKRLKAYVEQNKATMRTWSTRAATEAKNRSLGRAYDRTEGLTIMVSDIKKHAQLIPVEDNIH